MLTKTIKITNRKNVLVQIPGFIMAIWCKADRLEVHYNADTDSIIIRPKRNS